MTQPIKTNYGIDAPGVIRNLLLIGLVVLLLSIYFPVVSLGSIKLKLSGFIWTGICLIITGLLMVLYSKVGKFKHRNRILNRINWNGDEKVLDVGTGLGLLMIGAAKRLTTGKAYGIDFFAKKDLSNNSPELLKDNARIEGVEDRIEIVSGNIIKTGFENNFFDIVLSNLCLHNPKSCIRVSL